MPKVNVYQSGGFYLLTSLNSRGTRAFFPALVTITKGDALGDNGAGYATNAYTAFDNTFKGIAAESFDNATAYAVPRLPGQGDHALSTYGQKENAKDQILVIPPLQEYQFIVPSYSALITQAAVGTHVDLNGVNCTSVLLTDQTGAASSYLFEIDEIDVSAAALVGNQYGYAIGHFVVVSA